MDLSDFNIWRPRYGMWYVVLVSCFSTAVVLKVILEHSPDLLTVQELGNLAAMCKSVFQVIDKAPLWRNIF